MLTPTRPEVESFTVHSVYSHLYKKKQLTLLNRNCQRIEDVGVISFTSHNATALQQLLADGMGIPCVQTP